MHELLERQLLELFGSPEAVPASAAPLLEAVDAAYRAFDARQSELAAANALLRSSIDSSDEGILIVDLERRIVFRNRRFEELWRASPQVLAAQDDKTLAAAMLGLLAPTEGFLERIAALYSDPSASDSEALTLRDGRLLERLSTPHRQGGTIVGRIWLFRDVTKRRRLEAQLRQAQKMEALGLLAAGVAHDFNNLLTVISGHAELLLATLGGSPAAQGAQRIFDAAARAGALTRQLLAFGRRQRLEPVSVDLNDVVRELSDMVGRLVHENIEMRLELAPNLDRVFVDRGQLEQAILNLVVNARDAMPDGGNLTIATECFDALEESLWGARGRPTSGQWVVVRVEDSGVGMPQEVLDHIFDPFFTTKAQGGGTGLGLAMVYGFVQQSGGRVTVRSQVARGSVFEILLPKSDATAPVRRAEPASPPTGSESVLIVDDNAPLLEISKHALELRGYRVFTAPSSDEALALARAGTKIDLLLTDVVLPGRSGVALAAEILRLQPAVRVLFASGYGKDELARQGTAIESGLVLPKPFTLGQLASAVREALDAPGSPAATS